jgi:hypothetical protein
MFGSSPNADSVVPISATVYLVFHQHPVLYCQNTSLLQRKTKVSFLRTDRQVIPGVLGNGHRISGPIVVDNVGLSRIDIEGS